MADNNIHDNFSSRDGMKAPPDPWQGNKTMPIAVIGMSCRLPSEANGPEKLWDMLMKGESGWATGNDYRFQVDPFYHPNPDVLGTMNAKGLHFLKQDPALFDARFFSISPLEAVAMDPQQRMLLEVAYEAFENSGIPMERLSMSPTGVYVALFGNDYQRIILRDTENYPSYSGTGTGLALASNRLSYFFNLKGPSFTLDTGCSGGLVALHQACQSLRAGESKMCMAAGSNLILDPQLTAAECNLRLLSDAGRCFTFDTRGNGYGRGEGVAAVVVKPLEDALKDGDPIRAVIRNTVVNQDGRTAGITMPSADAQKSMIRTAYAELGMNPSETPYIEIHGTGTQVGDQEEIEALSSVFRPKRSSQPFSECIKCGCIKTNVGHTENVAGIAGLIKTVLVLENQTIPPNINYTPATARSGLNDMGLEVPLGPEAWPENAPLRASCNSFGYGGTNAHAILDNPHQYFKDQPYANGYSNLSQNGDSNGQIDGMSENEPYRSFILSANSIKSLRSLASKLIDYLSERKSKSEICFLKELSNTLLDRRSMLTYRTCLTASTRTELIDSLSSLSKGQVDPRQPDGPRRVCFVFTGQGAQWWAMGRELINRYNVFAESLRNANLQIQRDGSPWDLLEELHRDQNNSQVHNARLSQPLCTAVQVALVDLIKSWGLYPDITVGHSSGEIGAAYAFGALTLEDAISISYHRGRALSQMGKKLRGGMMAVGLSAEEASRWISKVPAEKGKTVVACVNSPSSVTISGDINALDHLQSLLEAAQVFQRRLRVDYAYHSHHMQSIRQDYVNSISHVKGKKSTGTTKMVSTVTAKPIEAAALTAEYWALNMVSPVLFSQGVKCASDMIKDHSSQGVPWFLEIGPHAALAGPVGQVWKASSKSQEKIKYQSLLMRDLNAVKSTLGAVGDLFTDGVHLDLIRASLGPDVNLALPVLTDLPSYPWNHTRYWHECRQSLAYRQRKYPRHDLLGTAFAENDPAEPRWRSRIRISDIPWLKSHVTGGVIMFPPSGYISIVVEALRERLKSQDQDAEGLDFEFREVYFAKALLLDEENDDVVELVTTLRPAVHSVRENSSTWEEFQIVATSDSDWSLHCRGLVVVRDSALSTINDPPILVNGYPDSRSHLSTKSASHSHNIPGRHASLEPAIFYEDLARFGLSCKFPYNAIKQIEAGRDTSMCLLQIPNTSEMMPNQHESSYCIHPATLTAVFHAVFAHMIAQNVEKAAIPTFIESLTICSNVASTVGSELTAVASNVKIGQPKTCADIEVYKGGNSHGKTSIKISRATFTALSKRGDPSREAETGSLCQRLDWLPDVITSLPEKVRERCAATVPLESASEWLGVQVAYAMQVIDKTLASLQPEDEKTMTDYHKCLVNWMHKLCGSAHVERNIDLRTKMKDQGAYGEALMRMDDSLRDIITGKIDPLTILMKDKLLNDLYSDPSFLRCSRQMAEAIKLHTMKNPSMRFIEIGGGTAGSTRPVFDAFASTLSSTGTLPFASYDFTDVSTGFFENSRAKLEPYSEGIKFQRLDIERPASEQGFEEGSYDVVIASMVLHATAKMDRTLTHVRRLLKPGGKLFMMEGTSVATPAGLVFGTLPGWWLGAPEGRVDSPFLSLDAWDRLLKDTGFSGIDLNIPDYPAEEGQQSQVIIATATERDGEASPQCSKSLPVEIILPDQVTPYIKNLRQRIQEKLLESDCKSVTLQGCEPRGKICISLLEIGEPFLYNVNEGDFRKMKNILADGVGVLWITRGAAIECPNPYTSLITGMASSARAEDGMLKLVTLDMDPAADSINSSALHAISQIVEEMHAPSARGAPLDQEYADRNGEVFVPRVMLESAVNKCVASSAGFEVFGQDSFLQPKTPLDLRVTAPGLLETLHWVHTPSEKSPEPDEVIVETRCIAVNYRHVQMVMGQLDAAAGTSAEFGGIVIEVGSAVKDLKPGDRVAGLSMSGYSNLNRTKRDFVHPVPQSMSLETATSIPAAFCAAYYALFGLARLHKGETVLIQAATSALGQAAISVAQHLGAKVFVTVPVGDEKEEAESREFISKEFGIAPENVVAERPRRLVSDIRRLTSSKGVNVVLNQLSGELLRESTRCLATSGRFVEVNSKDVQLNSRLEMGFFANNVSFLSLDLEILASSDPALYKHCLETCFDLMRKGSILPVRPLNVKNLDEIEEAFRTVQSSKHMGLVLLRADGATQVKVLHPKPKPYAFDPDGIYLICGGLGGLGREIIRWMAQHGARHIISLSRSGAAAEAASNLVKELGGKGVRLVPEKCDISDLKRMRSVLEPHLKEKKKFKGVIQAALSLQDTLLSEMTAEQFHHALAGKVTGTYNLHCALPTADLDFFVFLSSGVGILGTIGQSSYAAGSTFQDAFARSLAVSGQTGVTIDVGRMKGAGYVEDNPEAVSFLERHGLYRSISFDDLAAVLNNSLHVAGQHGTLGVTSAQTSMGLDFFGSNSTSEIEVPSIVRDGKFAHMRHLQNSRKAAEDNANRAGEGGSGKVDVAAALRGAEGSAQAVEAAMTALVTKLSRLLAMPDSELDTARPISSYGADSLIAVELRNWVTAQMASYVQIMELMGSTAIRDLAVQIAERSTLVNKKVWATKPPS